MQTKKNLRSQWKSIILCQKVLDQETVDLLAFSPIPGSWLTKIYSISDILHIKFSCLTYSRWSNVLSYKYSSSSDSSISLYTIFIENLKKCNTKSTLRSLRYQKNTKNNTYTKKFRVKALQTFISKYFKFGKLPINERTHERSSDFTNKMLCR